MSNPTCEKTLCCKTIEAAVENWRCKSAVDKAIKRSLIYPEDCPKAEECETNNGVGCTCITASDKSSDCASPLSGIMEAVIPVAKKKTTVVVVKDKKEDSDDENSDKS